MDDCVFFVMSEAEYLLYLYLDVDEMDSIDRQCLLVQIVLD